MPFDLRDVTISGQRIGTLWTCHYHAIHQTTKIEIEWDERWDEHGKPRIAALKELERLVVAKQS